MAPPPQYPQLTGLGWSVIKTPMTSTTIATHVSGREVRVKNYANPLYSFEHVYDGLDSAGYYPGLYVESLQILMAFYNSLGGPAGTFLYSDNSDNYQVGQVLGIGDGFTTTFQFFRQMQYFAEPVGYVNYLYQVLINGSFVSNYSFNEPTAAVPYPNIVFYTPPEPGSVITADYTSSYVCRFSDDSVPFEQIMNGLWQVKSLKFQTVRNGGF